MKLVQIGVTAVAAGLVVALAGAGRPGPARGQAAPPKDTQTVTVTGTGSVDATPDRAQFSFGVTTQAATATEALNENATIARRVISALKAAGVAGADIQTQAVSLEPRYTDDGAAIIGYTATNTVAATLRDIGRSGAVVDAAVGAGANQVQGPSLTRSDQSTLYATALRAAFADARSKAQAIARATGTRLGAARNVTEGSAAPPPEPVADGAFATAATPTPVEPGKQTIQATVTVEFAVT
jgi:uncharacterized protein YggE